MPRTYLMVFRSAKSGLWHFRVRSGNNKTISASQPYTRKSDAIRGAHRAYPSAGLLFVRSPKG